MEQKIRQYINQLFAAAPATLETHDAREELCNNSMERYRDLLERGFDQQEAYDMVIDSIGDIRELMEELSAPQAPEPPKQDNDEPQYHYDRPEYARANDSWKDLGNNISDMFKSIGNLVSDATSEAFRAENWERAFDFGGSVDLVNRVIIPLEGCGVVNISYISDQITIGHSRDGNVVVEEYMNRDNPDCFCRVEKAGGVLTIRNGSRMGQMLLRSKIKILIPADFQGELSVATQSGSIVSNEKFRFSRFVMKSVSGSLRAEEITADEITMHTTSGSIKVDEMDGNFSLHSVSGSIRAEDIIGCGEFKTTSGSIRVDFEDVRGGILATSVSGGIRFELPEDVGLELNLSSVSGGIHTDFDDNLRYNRRRKAEGNVGRPPYFPVTVRTTSGGIHIND